MFGLGNKKINFQLFCSIFSGSKQTSLKAKDRKRIGRKNTKEAVSKTQTSQELAATDENKNKIRVPDSNKNIVKQTCSSKAVKRNTRKKSKELKTPEPRDGDKTEDDEKRSGFCPNCQMPYTALSIVQSPTWHVNECLDTPYSSKEGTCNNIGIHPDKLFLRKILIFSFKTIMCCGCSKEPTQ